MGNACSCKNGPVTTKEKLNQYFMIEQALLLFLGLLALGLSFTKPFYKAKRNAQDNGCPELDEDSCDHIVVTYLSPTSWAIKNNGNYCEYSCPFPQRNVEFRATLSCLTTLIVVFALVLRLQPHSPRFFMAGRFTYLVMTGLWFAMFILDSDQTTKGLEFCHDDFEVKDEASGTKFTLLASGRDIKDCIGGDFIGLCSLDLTVCLFFAGGFYIMNRYIELIFGGGLFFNSTAPPRSNNPMQAEKAQPKV